MASKDFSRALFTGAATCALLWAPAAWAQAQASGEAVGLEEVVVTATRQTDTVNRVPLSIAAVTQQTLDQQGVRQAGDITRLVPGLNLAAGAVTPGVGTFSIRGIVGGTGAATTGVYLDDTSLTKRANNGVSQNNGAPLPVLFDLERVEVLKGPQGTLYGGSSQGGTVRFITPEPSLTTYSGMLRLEGRKVKMGDTGYQVGAAVGGPIVADKLAFRVSAMRQTSPGFIDAYSPYTFQVIGKNVNENRDQVVRAAIKWQVNDRGSIMLSAYASETKTASQVGSPTQVYSKTANGQLASASEIFQTPQVCINTQTRTANQPVVLYNPALPVGASATGIPVVPATCGPTTPASAQFIRAAQTYGPFKQGRDIAWLTTQQDLTGSETRLEVQTITLNYDFDHMNVKSITSFIHDASFSSNAGGEDPTQQQWLVGGPLQANGSVVRGFPLFAPIPNYPGRFTASSKRNGVEQELRFSSPSDQRPFTWVAGLFYSNQDIHQLYYYADRGLDASVRALYGVSFEQRYGIQNVCGCDTYLEANINDNELAGFAEANYWFTDKLKATAGVRLSRIGFSYGQLNHGAFNGRYPNSANSVVSGQTVNSPTTPKVGLEYDFTPNDLVYVTAAKGFRAGGINSPVAQSTCQVGLDQFGITANDVPKAFAPDSVWSYEAGGKFRLLDNKLQLNGAVYRIDWTGIQSTITIPGCGQTFVQNGGKARSQGVDFQGQFRPIQPVTLTLNVGYTDAKYVDPVAGPRGPVAGVLPSINAGDHFAIPKWQVSSTVQYDFALTGELDAYLRADYQWQSSYVGPGTFGVATFNPYTLGAPARDQVNVRAGVRRGPLEVNVFANNLLDGRDKIGNAGIGISGCQALNRTCSAFTQFTPFVNQNYQRPREIGVQANYRF